MRSTPAGGGVGTLGRLGTLGTLGGGSEIGGELSADAIVRPRRAPKADRCRRGQRAHGTTVDAGARPGHSTGTNMASMVRRAQLTAGLAGARKKGDVIQFAKSEGIRCLRLCIHDWRTRPVSQGEHRLPRTTCIAAAGDDNIIPPSTASTFHSLHASSSERQLVKPFLLR